MDIASTGLFLLTAIALLGSPGPGIAALVAVGREQGLTRGLRFYGGLQLGLAAAAAISAGGLFSAILTVPYVIGVMAGLGALYLGYLAFRIATAPVGIDRAEPRSASTSAVGGLVLGITNPKAYIAFVSLMASHAIVEFDPGIDVAVKWLLCVIVVLVVDLGWLWLGTAIGRISWRPVTERIFNILMGATIVIATLAALV